MKASDVMTRRVVRWWRNWKSTRSNIAQLEQCGPDEVNRIAHDTGLASHELRALAGKWPDSADLLNHRLHALGLDTTAVSGAAPHVLRDLQRTCSMCDSKGTCARDLARDERDPRWQTYCPNVATLDAVLMEAELRRADKRTACR